MTSTACIARVAERGPHRLSTDLFAMIISSLPGSRYDLSLIRGERMVGRPLITAAMETFTGRAVHVSVKIARTVPLIGSETVNSQGCWPPVVAAQPKRA